MRAVERKRDRFQMTENKRNRKPSQKKNKHNEKRKSIQKDMNDKQDTID